MWKDFNSQFDGILRSLRRHKELIESRANLAQYRRYQEDMRDLKDKLGELVEVERNKKALLVKEWLATGSQAQIDHENFLAVRQHYPNTGRWILKNESILNWITADIPITPLVWLNGIPGAGTLRNIVALLSLCIEGKTILTSVIIEECKRQKDVLTSYFYCSYDGPGGNSALTLVRSLLEQILDQFPHLLPFCHDRYSKSGEKPSLRSFSLAKSLIKDFCLTAPKQYIVIDGLDECEITERKQILELFVDILGECEISEPGKLRVLFVSQDYTDIKNALHSPAITRVVPRIVSISPNDNENDIQVYADDLTMQIKQKFDLDDMQQHNLRQLTVARGRGKATDLVRRMYTHANPRHVSVR
jgi:hypothetical protein